MNRDEMTTAQKIVAELARCACPSDTGYSHRCFFCGRLLGTSGSHRDWCPYRRAVEYMAEKEARE